MNKAPDTPGHRNAVVGEDYRVALHLASGPRR